MNATTDAAQSPDIADERLLRQGLTRPRYRRAADVVAAMGAVQAQEYQPAKWGLGLRITRGSDADVERAFELGHILRTHVMRPTWHFVTPADLRWIMALTAPRVHRIAAVYNRRLELDARTLTRTTAICERALRDRQYLTRLELGDRLQRAGLAMTGQRLAHVAMHAELEAVICSGPRRGKQFTYALVAERAPTSRSLRRDEALAELSRRYFSSHGPATVRDFVWWSGLTTADARRGLEMTRARRLDVGDRTYWTVGPAPRRPVRRARPARHDTAHLLPIYDEYLVSYRDRVAVPHGPAVVASGTGGSVTFQHALVVSGQIAGTWRPATTPGGIAIAVTVLRRLTAGERRAVAAAADRYARFLGMPVTLTF